MSDDRRVRERVATWQQWRAGGVDMSAEDLCEGAPELVEKVAAAIAELRRSEEAGTAEENVSPVEPEPSVQLDPAWDRLVEPAGGRSPQQIGDYRVVSVLGQGGMGTVYLAEDVRLHRRAAIKTMRPEAAASPTMRQRFLREARAAAAVEHDNIVPIWQVGEAADGTPFIAMPALRGETLEAYLQKVPRPPVHITLKIAAEMAAGLAAAHGAGLIHRDVKPVNVWLEGDPASSDEDDRLRRCKILDFGLVRTTQTGDARLTTSGTLNGTPPYIAPEQLRGKELDFRADLFALGVVLYRLATGEVPFVGESLVGVVYQVASHNPPPPREVAPDVPPMLSDIIMRLLHKEPEGRPASTARLAKDLGRLAEKHRPRRATDTMNFGPDNPPPGFPRLGGNAGAVTFSLPGEPSPAPVYAPPPPVYAPPPPPTYAPSAEFPASPPALPNPPSGANRLRNPASGAHPRQSNFQPAPANYPAPPSGLRQRPVAPPPPPPPRVEDDDDSFTWNRAVPPPGPAPRHPARYSGGSGAGGLFVVAGLGGILLAVVGVLLIRGVPTSDDGDGREKPAATRREAPKPAPKADD